MITRPTSALHHIRDERIAEFVQKDLDAGGIVAGPLIQLNPSFQPDAAIYELVASGTLHQECAKVFRKEKRLRM
jgi:hypothetical protein